MKRAKLFGTVLALVIAACTGCSKSGSGSESNFVECRTDADCDSGVCINEQCEARPVASSTDGGGSAGTESGASGGTAGSGGSGGMAGAGGFLPDAGFGLPTGVAEPCTIDTFYIGDEFCILSPSPGVGFQVHFGPASYDEPAISPFLFGSTVIDVDDCVYVKSPNTTDVYVSVYHLRARPSAAHIEVMALSTDHPDGLASCEAGFDYRPLAATPWSITSEDFPDRSDAPENAGLAMRIAPSTQLAVRMRSIQTSTEPLLFREAWVNFIYEDPATITSEVDPLMLVAGTTTQVPMFSSQVVQGSCVASSNVRILDLLARSHVPTMSFGPSGDRATVWKVSGSTRTLVYESYDREFARLYYDSVHQNPQPDRASFTSGGHNGVLNLAQGDTLEWECEIVNTTARPLQYSEASPACSLYGRYAPSFGGTWSCVSP